MGKRLLFVGNGIDLLTGCRTTYSNFIYKYEDRAKYLVGKKLCLSRKIRLRPYSGIEKMEKMFKRLEIKYILDGTKTFYFHPPYEMFCLTRTKEEEFWYATTNCEYWGNKAKDHKYKELSDYLYNYKDSAGEKKYFGSINGYHDISLNDRNHLMKEVKYTFNQVGMDNYKNNKKAYEYYLSDKDLDLGKVNIFLFTFILIKWNVIGIDKYINVDIENWGDLEYFIKEMARDDSLLIDVSEEFDIPYKNQKDESFEDLKRKLSEFIEEQAKLNDKIKVSKKVSSLLEASKVINFNYKGNPLIEKGKDLKDILYVHGKYQERENIILGFDESANKSLSRGENKYKTDMIHMSKIFQYTLSYGDDKKEVSKLVKKYWDTVSVIGHSISESDYSYFFNILDKNLDNSDFKIELLYYKYKSNGKTVTNEYNLLKSSVQMLRAYEVYSGKECMNMLYEGKLVKRVEYDYSKDFEIV